MSKSRPEVLAAVALNGWALGEASVGLKNDKEVVLAAVAQDERALSYASAELKNDKEKVQSVVLAAVAQDGSAPEHEGGSRAYPVRTALLVVQSAIF